MNGTTTIDEAIKEAESELEAVGLRIQKLKLIRRHYPDAVAFRLPSDEWAFASEAAAAKAFDAYNRGEYRELVQALQATTQAILDRKAKLAEAHPDVRPS